MFLRAHFSRISVSIPFLIALFILFPSSIETAHAQTPPDAPPLTASTTAAPLAAQPDVESAYDSVPATFPGSFPSIGYQATASGEAGDHVILVEGDRALDHVIVSLTNWSCENDFDFNSGSWTPNRQSTEACQSSPNSSFSHPITLNLYEVDQSGAEPAVGPLIATQTIAADIPFRPSWSTVECATGSGQAGAKSPADDVPFGGTWYDAVTDSCVHGYAFTIEYDFSADGVVVPNEVIVTVAFDTGSYGQSPTGMNGPYNSLMLRSTGLLRR